MPATKVKPWAIETEDRRLDFRRSVTGALTTVSLQTMARGTLGAAAAGGDAATRRRVRHGQERLRGAGRREKKLITDAISGMVGAWTRIRSILTRSPSRNFIEGTSGRFVGVGIEITQEDGLVKVVSPIEGSPLPGRPEDQRPDHRGSTTPRQGPVAQRGGQAHAGEPNTKVTLDHLPQGREPHLPGDDHARGDPHPVGARQGGRTRLCLLDPEPVPGAHRRGFRAQARGGLQAGAQPWRGLVLDLRNDPGGLLDAAVAVSAVSARDAVGGLDQRPVGRQQVRLQGPRPATSAPRQLDPLKRLPAALQERFRWWCWSTKARPRPARSWPARCRTTAGHHHGQPDLRQGLIQTVRRSARTPA